MDLKQQLTRDEGRAVKPYRDSVGKLTIGVGRNLDDKGLSLAEVDLLLEHDIADATADIDGALPWTADIGGVRRAVFINMGFNLGLRGLLGFHRALAAAEAGDWPTAAAELLDSKWAEQVGLRAHRLAEQLRTGEWQ